MGTELKKEPTTELDAEMLENLDLLLEYEAVKDEDQLTMAEELPEEGFESAKSEEEPAEDGKPEGKSIGEKKNE